MSEQDNTTEQVATPRWFGRLRNFDGSTSNMLATLRSISLNLVAVLAVGLSLPILVKELLNSPVIIAPVSVPASIEATGLNGTVVANRLWDAWSAVNREVQVAKETRDVLPSSQRIQFQIPDSGLSFDSLIHHLRDFMGLDETTISGELVCIAEPCTLETAALRLRVIGKELSVVTLDPVGQTPIEDYWRKAISEVLLQVDPVRGIMATSLGNEERAIAELRKLVRANHPDKQWARVFAGVLLGNRGERDAAIASFDEALKQDPGFTLAYSHRANVLLASERIADARKSIAMALKLDGGDARSYMQLGLIEADAGEFAKAIAAYETAARLQPNSPQVQLGLGIVYFKKGDIAAAKKAYEAAIEIDPDFIEARRILSLLANIQRDPTTALRHLQAIAELRPNDAKVQADLADALEYSGDLKGAETAYQRAILTATDKPRLYKKLGRVLQKQLRHEDALASLLQGAALDPSLEDIWFIIGDSQLALGRHYEARKAYDRYIIDQPKGVYVPIAKMHLNSKELAP